MEKIRQKTIVEQVMDNIRNLIASGAYKTGDKLPTENELAERFGIGRSSIREAIKVFNYLGILESRTAKGTFVCDRTNISSEAVTWSILLGNKDLLEIVEMRGSIELWSFIMITEKYKNDPETALPVIKQIEDAFEQLKTAIEQNRFEEMVQADYDFHFTIIKSSKNQLFISIYDLIKSFMFEEIKETYRAFEDFGPLVNEHAAFIEALKTGDTGTAKEIIRDHIGAIKEKLIRQQKAAV